MFSLDLDDTPRVDVAYEGHTLSYATDGAMPSPLEAIYAAVAASVGFHAKKACRAMGMSAEGVGIKVRPVLQAIKTSMPVQIATEIDFPARFSPEQRELLLLMVSTCPVKDLIANGHEITFSFSQAIRGTGSVPVSANGNHN